jgi:hypothetical protein
VLAFSQVDVAPVQVESHPPLATGVSSQLHDGDEPLQVAMLQM